jgi:hypothetical protein
VDRDERDRHRIDHLLPPEAVDLKSARQICRAVWPPAD